jgi:hypothetical protein
MSIQTDVHNAFIEAGGGKLRLENSTVTQESAGYRILLTGFYEDGTPFYTQPVLVPVSDPAARARVLAADLLTAHTGVIHMPAPVQIRGLAATLRDSLKSATDRADKLGVVAKSEVANLHSVLDEGEQVITDVKKATAEVQAALGLNTNGGDPL